MTPVLGIPVINRPDLLEKCVASIDIPVRLCVIDNSGDGIAAPVIPDDAWLIEAPNNWGVAASLNLILKSYPAEPYWLLSNADVEFAPGDLSRLVQATESGDWGWVGLGDWRAFGLRYEALKRVGYFDENYHPAFCEDADLERRASLAGVRWGHIESNTSHVGSVSLEDHRAENAATYPANVEYYERKWHAPVRGEGGFATPHGAGGSLADWTLEPRRLRRQRWRGPDGRTR